MRSNAKVLGTSCYKKGLEGVFGWFLGRSGVPKSAKKAVFYDGFVTFCVSAFDDIVAFTSSLLLSSLERSSKLPAGKCSFVIGHITVDVQ